jgi:hypothetical protein
MNLVVKIPEEVLDSAQEIIAEDSAHKQEKDCISHHLAAVLVSMSPEQLREFASGLITEANRREGCEQA